MNAKSYFACLLGIAAGAAILLQACDSSPVDNQLPPGDDGPSAAVTATLVASPEAVVSGPPGAYYISEDRTKFYLRCPGGHCTKHNVLTLEPATGAYVWRLTGEPGRPTLSPSIHWFETNGVTTHWHGWLRNGVFEQI